MLSHLNEMTLSGRKQNYITNKKTAQVGGGVDNEDEGVLNKVGVCHSVTWLAHS